MSKGLDLIKRQQPEIIDGFPTGNIFIGVTKEELTELEKELKDYQEIREIAKHFNWDIFTSEIFSVETDKKYRDLFNGAIVYIQENYRKARTLEIIKEKGIILQFIKETYTVEQYNAGVFGTLVKPLAQEEYDLLKKVML